MPPTMTSTRPGSSPGLWRRSAAGSVASVRNTSSAAARVRRKWWMRSRSYSARPCSTAATVDTVPATPMTVPASRIRRDGAARRRRGGRRTTRRARRPAPRARAGRTARNCSVRRTQPDVGGRHADPSGPARRARTRSSPRRCRPRATGGEVAGRGRPWRRQEGEPALLVPSSSSGRAPRTSSTAPKKLVTVGGVARRARGRRPYLGRRPARRSPPGRPGRPSTLRAMASGCRRRSASTPWPSRVIVMRRASVDQLAVGAGLGHEQPGGVRAEVDRRRPGRRPHGGRARSRGLDGHDGRERDASRRSTSSGPRRRRLRPGGGRRGRAGT